MAADQAVKGGTPTRHTPGTGPARKRRKPGKVVYVETHAQLVDGVVVAVVQEVPPPVTALPIVALKGEGTEAKPSLTAEVRRELLEKLRWACWVINTLPGGMERRWLGGAEVRDVPDVVRHSFSPAEISRAHALFDLVLAIPDAFMRKVVAARLIRTRWETIRQFDPQHRTTRRLQQLHDEAVNHILVRLMTKSLNPVD